MTLGLSTRGDTDAAITITSKELWLCVFFPERLEFRVRVMTLDSPCIISRAFLLFVATVMMGAIVNYWYVGRDSGRRWLASRSLYWFAQGEWESSLGDYSRLAGGFAPFSTSYRHRPHRRLQRL